MGNMRFHAPGPVVPVTQRQVVSVRVARQLLGDIGHDTLYRMIRAGKVEKLKSGGKTLITTASIARYIASLRGKVA